MRRALVLAASGALAFAAAVGLGKAGMLDGLTGGGPLSSGLQEIIKDTELQQKIGKETGIGAGDVIEQPASEKLIQLVGRTFAARKGFPVTIDLPGQPLFDGLADDAILRPTLSWRLWSERGGAHDRDRTLVQQALQRPHVVPHVPLGRVHDHLDDHGHGKRDPGAVDDPAQDVTAEGVGPQPVGCARRLEALAEVVPFGGKFPTLGTNPHSWGFPTTEAVGYPIVIDWATSVIAMGRVQVLKREGKMLPPDAAVDKDGNPTTDARAALRAVRSSDRIVQIAPNGKVSTYLEKTGGANALA